MASISLALDQSLLVVVDVQEGFLDTVWEADRVLSRCMFLLDAASVLGIPSIATAQNPDRLGRLHPEIASRTDTHVRKMSFSAWGEDLFRTSVVNSTRRQIVLAGLETHICVCLTGQDLLAQGYQVAVCPDCVSSSNTERHKLGMERLRDAGVVPIHSEATAYEWIRTAEDPAFRTLLQFVKKYR